MRRPGRCAAALLASTALAGASLAFSGDARATDFLVTSTADSGAGSLRDAISQSNTAGGTNNIIFNTGGTITLASELPVISSNVTINGNGNSPTISGNNTYRPFLIGDAGQKTDGSGADANTYAVTLQNLSVTQGKAQGGAGVDGGGGGGGLGGAVFVSSNGALTLTNVTLSNSVAHGGNGQGLTFAGGGGGGMGGNGGTDSTGRGNGGGGLLVGSNSTSGLGTSGGGTNGGAGAFGTGNRTGGAGGFGGGGGGANSSIVMNGSAHGGAGGFGGGGGGAFPQGTAAGTGGNGGYGGGGGAARGAIGRAATGGNGGFGGGGGSASNGSTATAGTGGFGAGTAGVNGVAGVAGGGGGLGAGGAVYVQAGGTVAVNGALSINGNTVAGGNAGGTGATGGSAFGDGIFFQATNGVPTTLSFGAGDQTIGNVIADYIGSGGTNPGGGANAANQGGSVGIAKTDTGTLTLSATNTYTGGTTVSGGGFINFNAAGNFGSGNITLNGGGLQWATGTSTDISGKLNAIGTNGATFDTNGSFVTFATGLTGTGALTKTGAGTLSLGTDSSYGGGTNLNAGSIRVSTDNALGSGTLAMANGTVLQSGAANPTIGNAITLAAGSETIDTNGTALTLTGQITGAGSLAKASSGTLTLNNDTSNYAGGTTLNFGTIAVGADHALGTGALAMANGTTLQSGAAGLTLANAVTLTGSSSIDTNGNTMTLSGAIGGAGSLGKDGAGTLILTNNGNNYSGGTNFNVGTIQVQANNVLGTGTVAMATGTTLQSGAAGVTLGNAIALLGANTIDTQANTLTLSGPVISGGSLTKIGAGTLILASNISNYSGGTSLTAGTIQVQADNALGTGTLAMATGTTLQSGAAGLAIGNAVTLTGADNVDTSGSTMTLSGAIGGTGNLTKVGAGTLVLSNNGNNYSGGTNLTAGTI